MLVAGVAAVVAVARVAALAGHPLVWSRWSPIAYLWQDALVVLVYAAIEAPLRTRPRVAWITYVAFVTYVAISVPVMRVMSTPMTWTMWRAAGGALSDSIWVYVTAGNAVWLVAIATTASAVPYGASAFRRIFGVGPAEAGLPVLLFLAALGPSARARVDTRGLDRNAWSALAATAVPRVLAANDASALHLSGPRTGRAEASVKQPPLDLTSFRGAAAGRNVILVSLESTGAQYLSIYGAAGEDTTPNLSALARSAIVFDHAYAVYPESIKGLFSMLCSRYPAFDRAADSLADVPCRSIASHLSARGYRSALFHSGRFGYLGMDAVVRRRGFAILADAGDIGGQHESSFGVDDRTTVELMLGWIDRVPRDERFFATYLPIAGHHPYESPEAGPFPAADEFTRYRNALHYGDAALGDLIDGLRARHLDTNTLWIVLGDHGEAFGQHDGNFGHTFQLYEENVHVPFLIAAPGLIPRSIHASQVVSLLDAAPTMLDLLGLPPDADYEGQTMLAGASRMAFFFADYSLGLLGLRDGNLKYIYEIDSQRSRMFDLDRDPAEAHDIAASDAATAQWYSQRVLSWIRGLRSN